MTTIVHGIQLSPFARKVILALEAKGVAFTINPVTPMEKPEGFEVLSPLGKVPAFEDDQLAISDSSVICEYIDQRYPQTPLYPEDLVARARVRWFEEYSDSAVLAVIGPIFFERLVKTALLQQTSDEARVEEVIANQLRWPSDKTLYKFAWLQLSAEEKELVKKADVAGAPLLSDYNSSINRYVRSQNQPVYLPGQIVYLKLTTI